MYEIRFGNATVTDGTTLTQLRGMEGGIGRFGRNYRPDQLHQQDPVNLALSAADSCLYGIIHAAVLALGLLHTGTQRAFVHDIADLCKAEATLPVAFSLHQSANPGQEARRKFRDDLRLIRLLPSVIRGADTAGDEPGRHDVRLVHLWDPKTGVPDHLRGALLFPLRSVTHLCRGGAPASSL